MNAVGIIAEYNPIHHGHMYHIEQAKALSGADTVVVALSGDYVQRGEPAIFDKWTRTRHALTCGADLVVEIPVLYCLGNAGQYAAAGVRILESTGKVSHIAFGSESGDLESLTRIAGLLEDRKDQIEETIKGLRSSGLSYPAARDQAYASIAGHHPQDLRILNSSNDILALEYIKAIRHAEPVAVKRIGSDYSDPFDEACPYQSASALRTQIFSGQDISGYVPVCTSESLKQEHLTGPDADQWFDALRYAVLSTPADLIEDCPSGGEGLAHLMKARIYDADQWTVFVRMVQSKRYTYTRISRLCMQAVLGITRAKYAACDPGYIRVLGFNDKGRQLLSEIRNEEGNTLPVITNINKSADKLSEKSRILMDLDMHASDIYNLMTGRDLAAKSDHRMNPVLQDIQ